MKVYIVSVENVETGAKAISSEGYNTPDAATAFILSRGDKPCKSFTPWFFRSDKNAYRIHEISIN